MSEKLQRFTDLMKQVFELDKSDLDFGIYRIMNIRKAEIEKFLTEGLPEKVRDTLAPFAQGDQEEIRRQMAEIEKNARDFGMDAAALPEENPMGKKYRELQKQLAEGTDLDALETDVYSALYSFFNRYYEEGDFISKRRYKEGVYAIPYEGEEVKLYWANQDQYYIKTSENFKDYTFVVDEYTVHFRLVDATTEQNNNKEQADSKRTFMLFTEDEENYPGVKTFEYNDETKELIIRFIFDIPEDKKKKYFDENYEAIRKYVFENHLPMWQDLLAPIPTGKGNDTTDLLKKHLNGYVAKNTFDYFIHKDLRGFLNRELDFYIKSEIMHLDDLDTGNEARVETYLSKVKAIKRVGKIIIDFLAQIEDFQKKLWLKKKFVVETNWCMTLDKVDESFWPEIIESKALIDEWIAMYAIDEAEGWTNPPSLDFLRQNQNLVIDTSHFNDDLKARLLASVDRLDEHTNGLMVFSENYQALSLMHRRYNGKIIGCYIDPPFNLGENADYLYKVDYKDSTWIAILYDRIRALNGLLDKQGSIFVRCSHDGNMLLRMLLNEIYGISNYRNEIILRRAEETKGDLNKQFGTIKSITVNYDNLYWFSKSSDTRFKRIVKPISAEASESHWHSFWKASDRPTMRFDVLGIDLTGRRGQWMWSKERTEKAVQNYIDYQSAYQATGISLDDYWRENGGNLEFVRREGDSIGSVKYWIPPRTEIMADSNWLDIKGYANKWGFKTENSEGVLKRVIESISEVGETVIDFFVGSGTTAAVALKLNRKFIGVDMGNQFYTVALPRLKYVLNGEKSGISSDCDYQGRGIVKYISLESYEDALSNIELKDDAGQMSLLFGEEYLVRYMLDLESKDSLLNIAAFKDPFAYKMKITEKNECKERPVDLIETFNYLIGLTVTHQGAVSYFSAFPASEPVYEGAVELRKDLGGLYAFRQIEGTLPDGRRALVIWRTVSDNVLESNAALDAYFTKYRINPADREYDVIFVNGDNNLENLRTANETWKVQMTETEFKKRMFEEA